MPQTCLTIIVTTLMLLSASPVWPEAEPAGAIVPPPPNEVTIGPRGSEQDPLAGRDEGLAVEPSVTDDSNQRVTEQDAPAIRVTVDPRVLGVAPGEPLPPLRREGEALRKRDGQLLLAGEHGDAVLILDADPAAGDEKPLGMFVAPCMTLESMERLLEERGSKLRFTITGQVYTYRGVNYLLPTAQPKPWLLTADQGKQSIDRSKESDQSAQDASVGPSEPEGQATEASATPIPEQTQATPSADDVLKQLLDQKRDRSTPLPTNASGSPSKDVSKMAKTRSTPRRLSHDPLLLGIDPDQPLAELKDEGQLLIARTGRLVRSADGSQALFVLDSDGPGAPEPPMILQACKLLETMEQTAKQLGDDVPFVVTGQLFTYRGANYLLPTIVKREFDRGNLE